MSLHSLLPIMVVILLLIGPAAVAAGKSCISANSQNVRAPGDIFMPLCATAGSSANTITPNTTGALHATTAVGSALNRAASGTSPCAATSVPILATGGSLGTANGWVVRQVSTFDGNIEGSSQQLTLGTSIRIAPNARIGLFQSSGQSNLTLGGIPVSSQGQSIGPYFMARLSDRYTITGYGLVARPDYTLGGQSYHATRQDGGLTVNASYSWGTTQIQSFLGLSGFAEQHPTKGPPSVAT